MYRLLSAGGFAVFVVAEVPSKIMEAIYLVNLFVELKCITMNWNNIMVFLQIKNLNRAGSKKNEKLISTKLKYYKSK